MFSNMDNAPTPSAAQRVGENMRRLRQLSGRTLAEVSATTAEVGYPIGLGTLSKIERGQRRIGVDDLEALAAALGVPVARLLSSAPPPADVDRIGNLLSQLAARNESVTEAQIEHHQATRQLEKAQGKVAEAAGELAREYYMNPSLVETLPGEMGRQLYEIVEPTKGIQL